MTNQVHRSISLSNMPLTTMGGGDGVHHYFGKGKGHRFRRGVKEIRQPLMRWKGGGRVIKFNLSVVTTQHCITIKVIIMANVCRAKYAKYCLFQINKIFIHPQPFNQHLYNIYKYIS